jgi:predicted Zn-ribbon and HTH transcriptional regulator
MAFLLYAGLTVYLQLTEDEGVEEMSENVHAKCQCGYEYEGLLYDCPVKCPKCGKLLLSVDREKE